MTDLIEAVAFGLLLAWALGKNEIRVNMLSWWAIAILSCLLNGAFLHVIQTYLMRP